MVATVGAIIVRAPELSKKGWTKGEVWRFTELGEREGLIRIKYKIVLMGLIKIIPKNYSLLWCSIKRVCGCKTHLDLHMHGILQKLSSTPFVKQLCKQPPKTEFFTTGLLNLYFSS